MSVLSSDLDPGEKAKMAPVTRNLATENLLPSSRKALSLTPACNGDSQPKKSAVIKRKNFFKRALSSDKLLSDNRKNALEGNKTESNGCPRVEIIYKDVAEENENYMDSNSDDFAPETPLSTRAFEIDNSERLRTDSLEQSAALSDDDCSPLSPPDSPDKNRSSMVSVTSTLSQSERVVQEIIATEQTYVKDLEEIISGYLKNMRKRKSPFTKQELDDLFMNFEEIHKFNKQFLEDLETCGDDPVQVALCFVTNEKGFDIYTDYCTKYPQSMEVLTLCTTKKETASFLQHMQVKLKHALPLGSYLLKPVQRILKYRLLLKDIKKHFDKDSDQEGFDIIVEALSVMTDVAHYINEMKRNHEDAVHVQEVQSQLTDFEGPDLTTYGKLVLEDSFRMQGTKTERYLFLFEKILLITKKRENSFSCKFAIKCDNMMMTESLPKEPLGFQVIRFDNQKINYSFVARNIEQKRKWMLELKRLIVDSLAARVPMRAKALILGEKNVEEGSPELKRRPLSSHHLQRASSFRAHFTSDLRTASKFCSHLQHFGYQHVIVKASVVESKLAELIPCVNCEHLISCVCQDKHNAISNTLIQENESSSFCEASFLGLCNARSQEIFDKVSLGSSFSSETLTELNTDSVGREEIGVIQIISCGAIRSPSSCALMTEGSPSGIKKDSVIEEKKENEEDTKIETDATSDNKVLISKTAHDSNKAEDSEGISLDPVSPGSRNAPVSIRVEDWERKSLTEDKESSSKALLTGGLDSRRSSSESTKEHLVEDNREIIGKSDPNELLSVNSRRSSCSDSESTGRIKPKTVTRGGTLPRRRSTEPVAPEGLRNRSWSGGNQQDDSRDTDKEHGRCGLIRGLSESPWVPKRSSSLKHLRSHLMGSASDLASIGSDSDGYVSEGVFEDSNDRGLGDIAEISAVKQTVREVKRAFSFSESTTPKKKPGTPHTYIRQRQTKYVIENLSPKTDSDIESENSPPRREEGSPTERPESRTLDDLLASIDRDLDETRHTISKAQLLESALRVRREGRSQSPILEVDHGDDVTIQRRTPVQELLHNWKITASGSERDALAREMIANKPEINGNTMSRLHDIDTVSKTKVGKYDVTVTKKDDSEKNAGTEKKSKVDDKTRVTTTSSKMGDSKNSKLLSLKSVEGRKAKLYGSTADNKQERYAGSIASAKTELKPFKPAVVNFEDNNMSNKNENVKPRLLSRNLKKPVVIEGKEHDLDKIDKDIGLAQEGTRTVKLKLRERSDKKQFQHRKLRESPFRTITDYTSPGNLAETASCDKSKEDKTNETSVYKMARQYSKKITEDRQVHELRSRLRESQRTQKFNSAINNNDYSQVNASPEIKIKRVTKVKFENKTLQDMAVVRRRRKSGGRGRDYRASWSYQKMKSELRSSTEEQQDRPKSAELGVPFDFIEECDDATELESDDVVSKGAVKELISKFDAGV